MSKYFLILSLLILLLGSCSQPKTTLEFECKVEKTFKGDCTEEKIRNERTTFPVTSPADDYQVRNYQVKLAIPVNDTTNRVWVKGSKELSFVQIFSTDASALSDVILLFPPFYTHVVSIAASAKTAEVKFSTSGENLANSNQKIKIYPTALNALDQKENPFSFLFYGCFQPFRVNPDTGESEVLHQKDTLNYVIRQMLTAVAQEKSFDYLPYQKETKQQSKLLLNPKLVIGGGDQVYTDAGYADTEMKDHPLSAWAHKCTDPYPLLDTTAFLQHLNRCYLHFNSFRCFEEVFSRLPSVNTWDDHEIRDGWGSHGDEYIGKNELAPELRPYYMMSRQAFVEHQYSVGPNVVDSTTIATNQSLAQQMVVNGINIFVFDLRSNRNSCENQVISPEEMQQFKKWCNQIKKGQEAVIVSSIPFFYTSGEVVEALSEKVYEGELRDDIIDSWSSLPNKTQRDTILQQLINLRQRDVKPIVLSGDVHIGGLITAWYENPKNGLYEKLCYEMVSSGLSHESLGEARSFLASKLQTRSQNVEKDNYSFLVNDVPIEPLFDFTRGRLNFGALEFATGKKTIASLFIINDNEQQVVERELVLDWEETFEDYWDRGTSPWYWKLMPWKWGQKKLPEVPYNSVEIVELLGK